MSAESLTMQQIKALELLLQGQSISATARQTGLHRSTIHNWCQQEPFHQALHQSHHQLRATLEHTALAALTEVLEDPQTPAAVKVRASLGLLRLMATQKQPLMLEQPKPIEPLTQATRNPKNEPGKPAPARNQPCPCGSTVKYKRCCLLKQPTARAA